MSDLTFSIRNKNNEIVKTCTNKNEITFVYETEYNLGDSIVFQSSKKNIFLILQLDDAIHPSFVYYTEEPFVFKIPFDENKICYSPKSFSGSVHVLTARLATDTEILQYKNLAKNETDTHENMSIFPHASANVETRGEATFAAKNAINGNKANLSHGAWPYESWGINQDPNAEITIDFGRSVLVDKIIIYLRADFPHDNYWEQGTLSFSDGSKEILSFVKSKDGQETKFSQREVSWVKLGNLVKSSDPALFPALTQIEIYGTEAK